jgi:hypothetical protein
MPNPLTLTDLDSLHRLADGAARRLRRRLRLPGHEQEDLRQDLLADLLARLPGFDPARGGLLAFASTCFRHRAARLADRHRRDAAARARLSLDDRLPHGEGPARAGSTARARPTAGCSRPRRPRAATC